MHLYDAGHRHLNAVIAGETTRPFLRNPDDYGHPSVHPASSGAVLRLLGLKSTAKLPSEGMPPRIIQGIKVWVTPLPDRDPSVRHRKRSTHRVMAECPRCAKVLSAGRLWQHRCPAPAAPASAPVHFVTDRHAHAAVVQAECGTIIINTHTPDYTTDYKQTTCPACRASLDAQGRLMAPVTMRMDMLTGEITVK